MQGFTEIYIKVERPCEESWVNEARAVRLGGWNADHTALTVVEEPVIAKGNE